METLTRPSTLTPADFDRVVDAQLLVTTGDYAAITGQDLGFVRKQAANDNLDIPVLRPFGALRYVRTRDTRRGGVSAAHEALDLLRRASAGDRNAAAILSSLGTRGARYQLDPDGRVVDLMGQAALPGTTSAERLVSENDRLTFQEVAQLCGVSPVAIDQMYRQNRWPLPVERDSVSTGRSGARRVRTDDLLHLIGLADLIRKGL
ncbi:hypothetical protein GCM10022286_00550 [Gryllotalpicola daejeonensis]|uniref:DNA-binding protein n=1 Tax=Gryllotalpicola daejeonensis TaxID=993087 RepID=A0ABP7ZCS8_9MICO